MKLKSVSFMPIPPPPTTYSCPACHWSKTVVPHSDALMPGEFFKVCPSCGHASLETKRTNPAQVALGQLTDKLKRLL